MKQFSVLNKKRKKQNYSLNTEDNLSNQTHEAVKGCFFSSSTTAVIVYFRNLRRRRIFPRFIFEGNSIIDKYINEPRTKYVCVCVLVYLPGGQCIFLRTDEDIFFLAVDKDKRR